MTLENAATHGPVSQLYQRHIQDRRLQEDTDQSLLLPAMDALVTALCTPVKRLQWRNVPVWRSSDGTPLPKGIYLCGPVGRGKSILMQMVFDAAPMQEKRRVHFHPFMEEMQKRMHTAKPRDGVDMVLSMASEISEEARLFCFDEFYVTNIGDAILLGRLLEALFQCGVTLCATSNWAPKNLFQDGYNRLSFLPFLDVLTKNIQVCIIPDGTDWRRSEENPESLTHLSAGDQFSHWTQTPALPTTVAFLRMPVDAYGVNKGVYWFNFKELCARAIGRIEYMELCQMARAVIISDMPQLGLTESSVDAAMRFVVLIDLLYEQSIPVRIFSHHALDEICPHGPSAFAFQRTISRIYGLKSLDY